MTTLEHAIGTHAGDDRAMIYFGILAGREVQWLGGGRRGSIGIALSVRADRPIGFRAMLSIRGLENII